MAGQNETTPTEPDKDTGNACTDPKLPEHRCTQTIDTATIPATEFFGKEQF
jgi:hypothetical protein